MPNRYLSSNIFLLNSVKIKNGVKKKLKVHVHNIFLLFWKKYFHFLVVKRCLMDSTPNDSRKLDREISATSHKDLPLIQELKTFHVLLQEIIKVFPFISFKLFKTSFWKWGKPFSLRFFLVSKWTDRDLSMQENALPSILVRTYSHLSLSAEKPKLSYVGVVSTRAISSYATACIKVLNYWSMEHPCISDKKPSGGALPPWNTTLTGQSRHCSMSKWWVPIGSEVVIWLFNKNSINFLWIF